MKKLWNSFKIAFSMYSKIPMPKSDWTNENMRYCFCFFPLVGGVVGALTCVWRYLAEYLGLRGSTSSAVVLMLIPVAVTGGIHLDGLLDTADALSSYKGQKERLEILKDSRAGAFAVIQAVVYFFLYYGIYSYLDACPGKRGEEAWQVIALSFFFVKDIERLRGGGLSKGKGYRACGPIFPEGGGKGRKNCPGLLWNSDFCVYGRDRHFLCLSSVHSGLFSFYLLLFYVCE